MSQIERNKRYLQKLSKEGYRRVDIKVSAKDYQELQKRLKPSQTVTGYLCGLVKIHLGKK